LIKAENFNIPEHKPRILIAPLDWGLGHATRCIPIISTLIQLGCTVVVAAEGPVKALLQNEFPDVQFVELKGYHIQYSRSACWMPIKLLFQFPKIIYRIYAENRWLKKEIKSNRIDAVIADNRMGLFHKKIPCIYITHQLTIKTGNRFTENIAQKIHYHYINKFSTCWVPDAAGIANLAGVLSHPAKLPKVPVTYLGPLSRFEKKGVDVKYDICIILSGPEPQRTIFEKIILEGVYKVEGKICLVRGLPGETDIPDFKSPSIEIRNHLAAEELNNIILQSKMIVSRCGYSTVMDLVKLQKKAILVPTPGQTEQEYLGRYLQNQKLFYCVDQYGFSLQEVLKSAASFNFSTAAIDANVYKTVIENFGHPSAINCAGT
jgi:uncharacterized protein (TIGR00661 family)